MDKVDHLFERFTRGVAQKTSRRGILAWLGGAAVGGGLIPALPVARASANTPPPSGNTASQDPGDPQSCDYWRYCAIDGFLCSCCGGSVNSCPPGTEMSPITWIGTCQNPADGRQYIISYNDCCGKPFCSSCLCQNYQGARPITRAQANNETLWCLGTSTQAYTCSTAIIVGLAVSGDK